MVRSVDPAECLSVEYVPQRSARALICDFGIKSKDARLSSVIFLIGGYFFGKPMEDEKAHEPKPGKTMNEMLLSGNRWWRMLAGASVALAVIGAFLPVMPTTPFLLVAAWAAKRGAPEMYERLHQHAVWGPTLRDWRDQRAIGLRAKVLAVVTMSASWLFLWFFDAPLLVLWITGTIFVIVAAFVLTRPTPRRLL